MNILLIGASGMIGSRILAEATSRGHHVTAAARRPEKIATGPHTRPVRLDATDKAALAMRGVLEALKASDTNWTFFSPALSIRPGEKTGKYRLGKDTVISDARGDSKISAEDFAHAVVNELEAPQYQRSQMTIAY